VKASEIVEGLLNDALRTVRDADQNLLRAAQESGDTVEFAQAQIALARVYVQIAGTIAEVEGLAPQGGAR
jgi:hypothetical protein